ncbi:ArdC-like ssDNA-binding domain-containing protein [Herbiconiux daphne]|uniref:ArdC-like ssDNA-binding domain-containing protein n=1 Tax=Herbiconiux daphne TaxID=2970914 RepID=A0ABT2H767_9MICO|nr:ArdC-like ssDNA-binding domain-containing protein [Herbiconiux daphne]MCS5735793.1 ArdC-like ssDNA-binding domain-containing protein [Herbiconiux daphne]
MRKVTNTRPNKSPEERRAQAEELQASIVTEVEKLRDTGEWERFLTFAQAFHNYSFNNLVLILTQCPTATYVAGFRKWQQLGRQVRKGERGIRIFGFRQKKLTCEDAGDGEKVEPGENGEKTMTYFPILSVFDRAQTDLIDPTQPDPGELGQRLTGDDLTGIYAPAADYLTSIGWTVTREPIPGEVNGYTTRDGSMRVVVDADLSPAQAAKTVLHEAGHVLLHTDEEPGEYIEHRGIKETEAESVAYIVAGLMGLDTSGYSIGYVAGWSNCDADTIRTTATRVLRAAHTLADALTDDPEQAQLD